MKITDMTRKQFEELPYRPDWHAPVMCQCIVILPGKAADKHDSGFRCMDFVAVNDDLEPVCRLAGGSDVLHMDGIGGLGYGWLNGGGIPVSIAPKGWTIDCLPRSGLLRLFVSHGFQLRCGEALSSFEAYAIPEDKS